MDPSTRVGVERKRTALTPAAHLWRKVCLECLGGRSRLPIEVTRNLRDYRGSRKLVVEGAAWRLNSLVSKRPSSAGVQTLRGGAVHPGTRNRD